MTFVQELRVCQKHFVLEEPAVYRDKQGFVGWAVVCPICRGKDRSVKWFSGWKEALLR